MFTESFATQSQQSVELTWTQEDVLASLEDPYTVRTTNKQVPDPDHVAAPSAVSTELELAPEPAPAPAATAAAFACTPPAPWQEWQE